MVENLFGYGFPAFLLATIEEENLAKFTKERQDLYRFNISGEHHDENALLMRLSINHINHERDLVPTMRLNPCKNLHG